MIAQNKKNKSKNNQEQNENNTETALLRETLPVFPVRQTVIFPYTIGSLTIENPSLIEMIDEIADGSRMAAFMPLQNSEKSAPTAKKDFNQLGTAGRIVKSLRLPEGGRRILTRGLRRITLERITRKTPYLQATVRELPVPSDDSLETEAIVRNIYTLVENIIGMSSAFPEELNVALYNIDDYGRLADFIGDTLSLSFDDKLRILNSIEVRPRLEAILHFLSREAMVLNIGHDIQEKVNTSLNKSQREHVLREQMRAIQQQLNEPEETPETRQIKERIENADLSPAAQEAVERELSRLCQMHPYAAEFNISRNYIDWILALPWNNFSQDRLNLNAAARQLDRDHYDLKEAKERILEFLAVMQLRRQDGHSRAPILCLVGPPGVGKTSLGQSIAATLQRQFVRISLGGIRDESEIRGHRRTYVGSLPGRIIQGLRRAGTANPVFMLDEIDKLGHDFRGDPSAALLEILDPAQNVNFSDHYLEIPFNLSQVFFVTTANLVDPIPSALRDRMEIIRLPGYTHEEKIEIGRKFLVNRQVNENGLERKKVEFHKRALSLIIDRYTRESGVRELERMISKLCRKQARQLIEGKANPNLVWKVTEKIVPEFLGPPRVYKEPVSRLPQVGIVNGLAWTQAGGEVLRVEAVQAPGKGNLTLTGSLGEVMKESARIALSYVRSKADELKIKPEIFEKSDIHIHVPSGAAPKDGPSAGVAIATALASLLTSRPAHGSIAMSGELSLRGQVMPVGGIKEKVLAAIRAGVKTILLPKQMESLVKEEVPPDLQNKVQLMFIQKADQAFAAALSSSSPREQSANKR